MIAERARTGFEETLTYVRGLRGAGRNRPTASPPGFLRILLRYPEILAWEYQYRLSREEVMKGMYDTIKQIKPTAPVGWHVDHWAVSMDLIARAAMSYAEMAPWSDYLKVVVYHAVTGPRIRILGQQRAAQHLGDLTLAEALSLHYGLFGYDQKLMPGADRWRSAETWPDYVFRETKRSVASAEGKTKIYPRDRLQRARRAGNDPEAIYQTVIKAYEARRGGHRGLARIRGDDGSQPEGRGPRRAGAGEGVSKGLNDERGGQQNQGDD